MAGFENHQPSTTSNATILNFVRLVLHVWCILCMEMQFGLILIFATFALSSRAHDTSAALGSIKFATVRTKHNNRAFVASTENFVDDFLKVPNCLCDPECTDTLLYFKSSEDIRTVFSRYNLGFKYRVVQSKRIDTFPIILEIEDLSVVEVFRLKLCSNMFLTHDPTYFMSILRFAVCSEDIDCILTTPEMFERFEAADIQKFRDISMKRRLERRTYTVLGQDILQKFDSIQIGRVTMHFRNQKLSLEGGWESLARLCNTIESMMSPVIDNY